VSRSCRAPKTYTDNPDRVVGSLTSTLLYADSAMLLAGAMSRMKTFEQRKYLSAIISFIVKQYFSFDIIHHDDAPIPKLKSVSGVASLLHTLTKDNDGLKDHLASIVTRSNIPSLDDSLAARRGIMAALAQDEGENI
jgi:telomere length regulation protein